MPSCTTPRVSTSRAALAYSATTLGAQCMNRIFQAFYVRVFLERYHLTSPWFYGGQVVFMIWNAINDPLFAWLQDHPLRSYSSNKEAYTAAILWGGPAFALSFLIPWFPWDLTSTTVTGVHFIVSLCFFDGMYTYVVLAQCALFADIETTNDGRGGVLATGQLASLLASVGLLFSYQFPMSGNAFGLYCCVLALAAAGCFYYTGTYAGARVRCCGSLAVREGGDAETGGTVDKQQSTVGQPLSTCRIATQVVTNRSFLQFVATNFLQIINTTVNANFHPMFAAALVGSLVSQSTVGWLLGLASLLGPALAVLRMPMVAREGTAYYLVRRQFLFKIALCCIAAWLGSTSMVGVLGFVVIHQAMASCTEKFFNMSVADIIDDDWRRHRRERRLSSTFFGINALFTKPAQSVAPMFVVAILSRVGYEPAVGDAVGASTDASAAHISQPVREAMFVLLWAVPLVCGCVQLALWMAYSLRGASGASG